ncbi:MAG: hypothetical protein JW953_11875 [Anaerolineae bacterium]|nr:hypothetical protein [Anaerolineae bacterium]
MLQQHTASFISLKSFLFLMAGVFAVAAVLLVILFTSAATVTGGTPFSAVTLAEGANTGVLAPGEQRWFKYNPDPYGRSISLEKSLTLMFTPDDGNRRYHVSLELFEEGQLQNFFQGDTSRMNNFGAAAVVDRDGNPETGELFWHGWLDGNKTYYVMIENGNDIAIDYWLFTEDVVRYAMGEPEPPKPEVIPDVGTSPVNPAALMPGVTKGSLEPHTNYWYAVTYVDYTNKNQFKDQAYTMFFTPDDGNRRHYINFELFPMSELGVWTRGDTGKMTNFGAGALVSWDGDPNTGERIWRGSLVNGLTYLVAVENGSDMPIDYYIFDKVEMNPELGPKSPPPAKRVFAQGEAPEAATALQFGLNKGTVPAHGEVWYKFQITDFDDQSFEPMALTMITTPDDGNRIYHMNMDIFTANGVNGWSPGDNSQITNIGAGSVVFRDDNPDTGEKFWSGWVVDNDLYYVQLRNHNDIPMDYWLYTGDVYRPELGEPTKLVARTADPGKAPFAALPLEVGINQGQLNPGEERWYSFSRADVNASGSIDTTFTLVFTPDDGNRKYNVSLELYEDRGLRDWAPDNRAGAISFGKAGVVNRDDNPETGEMLWRGSVYRNNVYYMRVDNRSDAVIDYWIFPEDVINANLQ